MSLVCNNLINKYKLPVSFCLAGDLGHFRKQYWKRTWFGLIETVTFAYLLTLFNIAMYRIYWCIPTLASARSSSKCVVLSVVSHSCRWSHRRDEFDRSLVTLTVSSSRRYVVLTIATIATLRLVRIVRKLKFVKKPTATSTRRHDRKPPFSTTHIPFQCFHATNLFTCQSISNTAKKCISKNHNFPWKDL